MCRGGRGEAVEAMSSHPTVAVLLDVDGSLVDSSWLHTLAWHRALRRLDHAVPMYRIHPLIGMGGDRLVAELVGRDLDGAGDAHQEEYEALAGDLRALPGARDLVRAIGEAGAQPVLATSSRPQTLAPARELLDVEELLGDVTDSGDVDASKPSPDIFATALERAGVPPERAVAVGDTGWDMRSAGAAGIPAIGLLTGGWRGRELVAEGAAEVYEDAASLAEDLALSIIGRALERAEPRPSQA